MIICCKKCGKSFESLVIPQKQAWKEIYEGLLKHVKTGHPLALKHMQEAIIKAQMIVAGYMTVSEFALVPEDNKWLIEHLEEMQTIIMSAAGFEPQEEVETEEGDKMEVVEETKPEDGDNGLVA